MSPDNIAEHARVSFLLADFANLDTAGKLNILGGGWQIAPIQPTGMTPPHALVVSITLPPKFYDSEFAVTLTLRDESGRPVQSPGPVGQLQALRVQQVVKAERPVMPGVVTMDKPWASAKFTLNFVNGLPLLPNQAYTWDLEIEGTANPGWAANFFVAAPSGPVIG